MRGDLSGESGVSISPGLKWAYVWRLSNWLFPYLNTKGLSRFLGKKGPAALLFPESLQVDLGQETGQEEDDGFKGWGRTTQITQRSPVEVFLPRAFLFSLPAAFRCSFWRETKQNVAKNRSSAIQRSAGDIRDFPDFPDFQLISS